jgi:hypothetical protein
MYTIVRIIVYVYSIYKWQEKLHVKDLLKN